MVDKELKIRWLEALRSGEYQQGTGRLRGTDSEGQSKFCCLGVLADLMGADWSDDSDPCTLCYLDGKEVTSWGGVLEAGRPAEGLGGVGYSMRCTLATMNDTGETFEEIADYIEDRL